MDNLVFSLNATMPVFILMMAGWAFRQCGVISESFASQMNRFVFQIALPVSLFTQLCDVDFAAVWDFGYVVFCFVATLLSILIAALLARLCAEKSDRAEFVQGAYRSSASLLGMAYIELIYGTATSGSLMMIGCVPLYNVAAVLILSGGQGKTENDADAQIADKAQQAGNKDGRKSGGAAQAGLGKAGNDADAQIADKAQQAGNKEGRKSGGAAQAGYKSRKSIGKTALKIVTNPIILGIVIGFAWSILIRGLLGFQMPAFLSTSCSYIGRLASPMGLLSMGAQLDFRKMTGKVRPALAGTFLKLVGFVMIFIPVAVRMGFTGEKLVAALIMLGSPSTVAGYIMARNMGHEGTLSASMVMMTTLLSSLTLTIWLWLLRSRGLV